MYIDSAIIYGFFDLLNKSDVEYVVLRDVDREIPGRISRKKDIDLLVNKKSKTTFEKLMKINKWKKIPHPLDNYNQILYLYALTKFDFFSKNDLNIDVCYELCCKSANINEWLPIDQMINNSVWENRRIECGNIYYSMCYEDELVHLLTRIIFDKKHIPENYIPRIKELFHLCDKSEFIKRSDLVFFKFTNTLLNWLNNNCVGNIVNKYYSFLDY